MSGIAVTGLDNVLIRLAQSEARLGDLSSTAPDVALVLQSEVDRVFESAPRGSSGGAVYGGQTWSSLTDAYLAQKPDRASGQIYRDTGALQQSMGVLEASGNAIVFGTTLTKASRLQRLRPFLFVTDGMVQGVQNVWSAYVVG